MDKAWKRTERAIARRLGGQRVGVTGRSTADVVTDWLSIEVKHRKELPGWLKDAFGQASIGAGGRLPIVILHENGQRFSDAIVMMRMADFEDWFGKIEH